MYPLALKHALRVPRGNNFFEFNLLAYGLSIDELAGKLILDVGSCDLSIFARVAQLFGARVVALDPLYRHGSLETCVHETIVIEAPEYNIPRRELVPLGSSVAGLAQELPFADGVFDIVVSYSAFPLYVLPEDYGRAVEELLRVTKSDGTIHLAPVPDEVEDYGVQTLAMFGGYDFFSYDPHAFAQAISAAQAKIAKTDFHEYRLPDPTVEPSTGVVITKK